MPARATPLILLALVAGCGGGAPAAFEAALAALRDGDLRRAEARAGQAATLDPDAYAARYDFLRGNVAFARCETAARQAETAAAEPFAFDVAILYAEKARDSWERAAMSRADWPAARRNVERALLKLAELRRKKAQAEERRKSDPQPKPRPQPPRPRTGEKETEPAPAVEARLDELSPEEVRRLVEKLAEKEREKLALRRARRAARTAGVARDW